MLVKFPGGLKEILDGKHSIKDTFIKGGSPSYCEHPCLGPPVESSRPVRGAETRTRQV